MQSLGFFLHKPVYSQIKARLNYKVRRKIPTTLFLEVPLPAIIQRSVLSAPGELDDRPAREVTVQTTFDPQARPLRGNHGHAVPQQFYLVICYPAA